MAVGFNVSGPTLIEWSSDGNTWHSLGYTTNDDLPALSERRDSLPLTSTQHGTSPREVVNIGYSGRIAFTLVNFDEAQIVDLLTRVPGATDEGQKGTVGGLWIGSDFTNPSRAFQIRITPSLTGQKQYIFGICYLDDNSHRISNFGNAAKLHAFDIPCIPDSDGDLFTIDTI